MSAILVVGGTSGIGEFVANAIEEDSRFNGDDGENAVVVTPNWSNLNVRFRKSIEHFFQYSEFTFDKIVYSAGVNYPGIIGSIGQSDLLDTYEVNAIGFIELIDAWVKYQGKRRCDDGLPRSVVAVVSDAATTAMRGSIAYASSKAALAHAVRCAARELAPHVRVNGVSPSVVANTPMTEKIDRIIPGMRGWSPEEALQYEMSLVPMRRRAGKDEVASLVLDILHGPEFLTGAIVPITGGK